MSYCPHVAKKLRALVGNDDTLPEPIERDCVSVTWIWRHPSWIGLRPLLPVHRVRPKVVAVARGIVPTEHYKPPAGDIVCDRGIDSRSRTHSRWIRACPSQSTRVCASAEGSGGKVAIKIKRIERPSYGYA